MNIKLFSGSLIASTLLCACGFKGDLYLPDDNNHKQDTFAPIQTGIGITPPTQEEMLKQENQTQDNIENVKHTE